MINEVDTRWNSAYDMIERAILLRRVIKCSSMLLKFQFGEEPDYIILESKGKPKEIAIALDAARSKLRKYYDKTENSPLYCIATGI